VSRRAASTLRVAAAAALAFAAVAPAPAALPVPAGAGDYPTLAPVLERVTPAVVNIAVQSRGSAELNPLLRDPFFRRFFDLPRDAPPRQSAGSGVIVDAEAGLVLTNHHVIENAAEIAVTLKDRRSFTAELVGSDPATDIALLRIEADGLTELALGDSDSLRVGDYVIAIGNPFGLGQTVTSGIVSALGRSGLNIEGYEDFIQTDASINPGNSGGALVNLGGDLVGINTAIIGPAGGNVGIGFAVPSNMARAVAEQLIAFGEIRRGRLGVVVQELTPDLADALEVDHTRGGVITRVEDGSPADEAGLEAGDVVVAIDGRRLRGSADLRNRIGLVPVGESVDLTVIRDGERLVLRARVGERGAARPAGGSPQLEGAAFRTLEPGETRYGDIEGVIVASVERGSRAARNGLREGDVIVAVNRTRVRDMEELERVLDASRGNAVALNVLRDGARVFIVMR